MKNQVEQARSVVINILRMQALMLFLKICGWLTLGWIWVFTPIFILMASILILAILVLAGGIYNYKKKRKNN